MAILPGTRVRDNGIFGVTTDNPLTIGAVTFNSAGLNGLSAIAGNHAIATLDPLKQFGNPEIVMITAHGAAATVATIQRGMFGTAARAHPQGTTWVHAAVDNDFIEILTSATRPTDQYEGQFIYETDTNKLIGFGGVDWAPRDAGGQLGYAQAVANQTGITTEVDLTSLSVAVTVGTGRRIKIIGSVLADNGTTDSGLVLRIREGGTQLQLISARFPVANEQQGVIACIILTPSAGVHTYKLTGQQSGAGTARLVLSATNPGFILVEDIGAA